MTKYIEVPIKLLEELMKGKTFSEGATLRIPYSSALEFKGEDDLEEFRSEADLVARLKSIPIDYKGILFIKKNSINQRLLIAPEGSNCRITICICNDVNDIKFIDLENEEKLTWMGKPIVFDDKVKSPMLIPK